MVSFAQDEEIAEQNKSIRRFHIRDFFISQFNFPNCIRRREILVKIIIREAVARSAEQSGIQQASNQWPKSMEFRDVRFSRIGLSASILAPNIPLILSSISMLCKMYFRTGRVSSKIDAIRYMLISAFKSFQGDEMWGYYTDNNVKSTIIEFADFRKVAIML